MKNITMLAILLLLITSCNTKKENNIEKRMSEISNIIKNELSDDKINSDVLINYSNDEHLINVDIIFDEPYRITDKDIQLELLSYLAYQIINKNLISDSEKIQMQIKYKEPNLGDSYGGIFDKNTNFNKFKNKTYVKLIKYCFKNFEMAYAYYFDVRIEYFLSKLPFSIKKENFIKLLENFSKTKRPSINNNADVIFMLYYSYNKILVNKNLASKEKLKMRKIEMKIIKDLWFIAKGRDIDEEIDFENEVLDPKNHKQKES